MRYVIIQKYRINLRLLHVQNYQKLQKIWNIAPGARDQYRPGFENVPEIRINVKTTGHTLD